MFGDGGCATADAEGAGAAVGDGFIPDTYPQWEQGSVQPTSGAEHLAQVAALGLADMTATPSTAA